MEWIIDILKKYQKEDGTIDLATAEQEIKSEFPKQAVPKTVFNEKSEQLKTANATIDELKNHSKGFSSFSKSFVKFRYRFFTVV